jgi:hypothetical protein
VIEVKYALWLNINKMCELNQNNQLNLYLIFTNSITSFEKTQNIYHKHLIMCQMLSSSQYLSSEKAIEFLLNIFISYTREDNIEFDEKFIENSFIFINKIKFSDFKELILPFLRCILIKPSQHLKAILCNGLKSILQEEFNYEVFDFLFEMTKDDQVFIQRLVRD